jgi:hypothetical protein
MTEATLSPPAEVPPVQTEHTSEHTVTDNNNNDNNNNTTTNNDNNNNNNNNNTIDGAHINTANGEAHTSDEIVIPSSTQTHDSSSSATHDSSSSATHDTSSSTTLPALPPDETPPAPPRPTPLDDCLSITLQVLKKTHTKFFANHNNSGVVAVAGVGAGFGGV